MLRYTLTKQITGNLTEEISIEFDDIAFLDSAKRELQEQFIPNLADLEARKQEKQELEEKIAQLKPTYLKLKALFEKLGIPTDGKSDFDDIPF